MSLVRQLAGETVIYGMGYVLPRILNYILLTVYLTRELGQEAYGAYNDLYAYAAVLLVLLTWRMETAFFRFGREQSDRQAAFSSGWIFLLTSSVLFVALVALNRQSLADWLQYENHTHFLLYFSGIIALDVLAALPFARLRLEQRARRFAVFKTGGIVLNILLVLYFLEAHHRIFGATGWTDYQKLEWVFLANLVASGGVLIALLSGLRNYRIRWNGSIWRKMIRYALPLVIVGGAGVINQSVAVPLQKYFLEGSVSENLSQGGIYAAAAKIALLMNLFIVAFNYAAEPFFFNQYDRKDSGEIYAVVARAFALAGAALGLGILLYLDVLELLVGASFREGMHIVPVLLLAYWFLGLYYNVAVWYKLEDRTMYGAWISLAGAALTLSINIAFLPVIGYEASAWAALACYGSMAVIGAIWGRRFMSIPYAFWTIGGYLLSAAAFWGVSVLLNSYLNPSIGLKLTINTAILALWIGWIWRRNRSLIRSILIGHPQ